MKWVLLGLMCLWWGSWGRWTEPQKYEYGWANMSSIGAKTVEPTTGITHFAYCNTSTGAIIYTQTMENGYQVRALAIPYTVRCQSISRVVAANKGSNIVIVYSALRGINGTKCEFHNTSNCEDGRVVESEDSGESWLLPRTLDRANETDFAIRQHFLPLLSPASGRLWIFYLLINASNGEAAIAMVSRAPGSRTFSREAVITGDSKVRANYLFQVAATYDGGMPVLQVWFYFAWNGLPMNIFSRNNGLTWSKPANNSQLCEGKELQFPYFLHDSDRIPGTLVALCSGLDRYFQLSMDHGTTWQTKVRFEHNIYSALTSGYFVGTGSNTKLLFAIETLLPRGVRMYYWTLNKQELATIETPRPDVNCGWLMGFENKGNSVLHYWEMVITNGTLIDQLYIRYGSLLP